MSLGFGADVLRAPLALGAGAKRRFAALSRAWRDVIALSLLGCAVMAVEYPNDLAPKLFQFAIDNQDYEVDNFIFMIFVMSLGFLAFSLRRMRELTDEIKSRRLAEEKASALARHDPLTGLPNRRFFIEMLEEALATTTPASPTAVLLLDLDGFKLVNDAYGHAVGDLCLVEFTHRIAAIMRGGARLIRLGGDEFAVIVPGAGSHNTPAALARQIIAEVAQPFLISQISASLGVGVGIAVAPFDAMEPHLLVQRADRALYRAKAEGRSRICFFEPEMDAHVDRRIALELDLRAAIAAGDITPYYQPIVTLKDERIVGFEALARWKNEKGQWVPPDQFVPMAEDLGLIGELGDQLLRKACRDALAWPAEMSLSFNVSARQLCDPTVGLRIISILGETGFSPRRLEIEITETAAVENIRIVQSVIGELRAAGVRIALDDFGTGYSTFAQLISLKPDRIKIDRTFVDKLGEDKERATIVRALLGLASGFNLATTAEGIENDRQFASLNADGCLEGQGYLFSKAVPASEVGGLIAGGVARARHAA